MNAQQHIANILQHSTPRFAMKKLHALTPEEVADIREILGVVQFTDDRIVIPRHYSSYTMATMLFFVILLWSGDLDDKTSLNLSRYKWLQAGFPRDFGRLQTTSLNLNYCNIIYLESCVAQIKNLRSLSLNGNNIKIVDEEAIHLFSGAKKPPFDSYFTAKNSRNNIDFSGSLHLNQRLFEEFSFPIETTSIDISKTRITSIPKSVLELPNLRNFIARDCALQKIEIPDDCSLQVLDISNPQSKLNNIDLRLLKLTEFHCVRGSEKFALPKLPKTLERIVLDYWQGEINTQWFSDIQAEYSVKGVAFSVPDDVKRLVQLAHHSDPAFQQQAMELFEVLQDETIDFPDASNTITSVQLRFVLEGFLEGIVKEIPVKPYTGQRKKARFTKLYKEYLSLPDSLLARYQKTFLLSLSQPERHHFVRVLSQIRDFLE